MRGIVLDDGRVIQIVQGDITLEQVDAIANAANQFLRHGGGVAGAISRAGGRTIQEESDAYIRKNGPLEVSDVAVTGAGSLACSKIIHVCGPQYGDDDVEKKLFNSFYNIIKKAGEMGLKTISIPAVSSGIFGVPKEICARAFFKAVFDYIEENPNSSIKLVRACNIDKKTTSIFEEISGEFIPK